MKSFCTCICISLCILLFSITETTAEENFNLYQLTDNDLLDNQPSLFDGAIAWSKGQGEETEIYYWDENGQIWQITDNDVVDSAPSLYRGAIAWQGKLTDESGGGSVIKNPDKSTYSYGEEVELTASTNPGYAFSNWSGDLTGSANPVTITMDVDKDVTAEFTQVLPTEYSLTVGAIGVGVVTLDPAGGVYDEGTVVTLTAEAGDGWKFTEWEGDLIGSQSHANLTMDGAKSVTATFTKLQYTLTVNISPELEDFEIFYWPGLGHPLDEPIQITDNDYDDVAPSLYNGMIAWSGGEKNNREIYFWDGNTITQISDNSFDNKTPSLYFGTIAWSGGGSERGDYEIFYWDGDTITQITDNSYEDTGPSLYNEAIAWTGGKLQGAEIYYWDGDRVIKITENNISDGGASLHGGTIAWNGFTGSANEIFFYDGRTTTQITVDGWYSDSLPSLYNGVIAWTGFDGGDYEIYYVIPGPRPEPEHSPCFLSVLNF